MVRQFLAAIIVAVGATGTALAASPSAEPSNAPTTWLMKAHEHLYAGHTAAAAAVVSAELAAVPDDDQARFALGAIQFLAAVEKLGQQLHRYGLSSVEEDFAGLLPIVRLPIPPNSNPDRLTYDGFRGVLGDFVRDLQVAEATLRGIRSEQVVLPLNIGLIRLDLNGDGTGSDDEALWRLFTVVSGARLNDEQARTLLVYFDRADVFWLQAYCHLLMAIAEFPLAYDWREAFMATFHGLFPNSEAVFVDAPPNAERILQAIALVPKAAGLGEPPFKKNDPEPTSSTGWLYPLTAEHVWSLPWFRRLQAWLDQPDGKVWLTSPDGRHFQALMAEGLGHQAQFGGIADSIAFIHLMHWQVIEPQRRQDVLDHLEAMVRLSRQSWQAILVETDDLREWIPSPTQTGVLPGMRITQRQVQGWQQFLDEFQAILDGRKLVPHWRYQQGVNLRRCFLESDTFDPVLLIQGSAAIPCLEDGESSSGATWSQIMQLLGGDFFRYFVWLN